MMYLSLLLAVEACLVSLKLVFFLGLSQEPGVPIRFRLVEWFTEEHRISTFSEKKRSYMQRSNTICIFLGLVTIATVATMFILADQWVMSY